MKKISHYEALELLITKLGFLPFFQNEISGFSVEEFTPQRLWFSGEDGPWEWKGPIIRNGNCAYGKLFNKKAGFVSMDWFPDLVNYRRSVYSLSSDLDTDTTQSREKIIYNTITEHESLLSKDIKSLLGYSKPRRRQFDPAGNPEPQIERAKQGFDSAITRLQMGTWIVVADFEYQYNKHLERYGWGIARYTTPEALFTDGVLLACKDRSPEESRQKIVSHLSALLPDATEEQISRIMGCNI